MAVIVVCVFEAYRHNFAGFFTLRFYYLEEWEEMPTVLAFDQSFVAIRTGRVSKFMAMLRRSFFEKSCLRKLGCYSFGLTFFFICNFAFLPEHKGRFSVCLFYVELVYERLNLRIKPPVFCISCYETLFDYKAIY